MKITRKNGDKFLLSDGTYNALWSAYNIEIPDMIDSVDTSMGVKGINMKTAISVKDGYIIKFWNGWVLDAKNVKQTMHNDTPKTAISAEIKNMIEKNRLSIDTDNEILDEFTALILTGERNKRARIKVPYANFEKNMPEIGDKFSYLCMDKGMMCAEERILEITYIRSGIVFYIDNKSEAERNFPIGCVFAGRLEPYEYVSDLNPEWYEVVPNYQITRVSYSKDYKKALPKFVKIDGHPSAFRLLSSNRYWRDGGHYGIEFEYNANSELVMKADENLPTHLHYRRLLPITEDEWRTSNGQYAPEAIS